MATTNPFDEDGPGGGGGGNETLSSMPNIASTSTKTHTTNPFEVPEANADDSAYNPFSSNANPNNNIDEDPDDAMMGDYDYNNSSNSKNNSHNYNMEEDDGSAPVEASWQFLGDLPYRRVPLYKNVKWNQTANHNNNKDSSSSQMHRQHPHNDNDNHLNIHASPSTLAESMGNVGLASFPPSYLASSAQARSDNLLDMRDLRELLSTTTVTKVAGCPNGGPIAAITLPIAGSLANPNPNTTSNNNNINSNNASAILRIMTSSGQPLASIEFPPRNLASLAASYSLQTNPNATTANTSQNTMPSKVYTPTDVLEIGFTDRCLLMVIMRDSLCVVYDVRGNMVLPPFHIMVPHGQQQSISSILMGVELMEAAIFEGGVAVLSTTMSSAIVEILDEHDDLSYVEETHLTSRKIIPTYGGTTGGIGIIGNGNDSGGRLPPHFAIVTPLPSAAYARSVP
jgi:hypothetical protein